MEEFLDVITQTGEIIGREKRSLVHNSGLWHRGVHVFLFTKDNKLVIQLRSKNRPQSPNALDCSVSEHLITGESFTDAAVRGLREELGIRNVPLERLVQFRLDYGPNDNMVGVLFRGVIDGQEISIDQNEIQEITYISITEAEQLLDQNNVMLSRWFRQLLLWYLGKSSEILIVDDKILI